MTTGNKIEKTVSNKALLLIVLAIIILLSLVSETTKTIPVSYTHLTLPTITEV